MYKTTDYLSIKRIISVIATIIDNDQMFKSSFYDTEAIENYLSKTIEISNLKYDLHSYNISNLSVLHCLKHEKLDAQYIKNEALKAYSTVYISKQELNRMNDWRVALSKYRLPKPSGILRIPIIEFQLLNSRIRNFLLKFDAEKCNDPIESESELIFNYLHGEHYYIAISVMDITQELIEKFSSWGQYSKLQSYYLGRSANSQIANKYNRLLTYKIADLLLNCGYILPSEKKHGLVVPMIEVKYYSADKKKCLQLGDIDLTFYSPFTQIFYILEFKNYQMLISRSNDFSYDLEKMERDKADIRIINRREYINTNRDEFTSMLYKTTFNDCAIKSIILTTKPCFYFFLNNSSEYDYYDWIQFKKRIENKEL